MRSFRGDCREAYVISNSYGMGDPLAPSKVEGNSGGGRHHPSVTVINDQPATILGGQDREIYPPLADSESEKRSHHHSLAVQLMCNLMLLRTH